MSPEEAEAAYARGLTTDNSEDYTTARREYSTACAGGEPRGCTNLGYLIAEGAGGAKDEARARKLFGLGCDGGAAIGGGNLGGPLYQGRGGPKDQVEGLRLLRKACRDGEEHFCNVLDKNRHSRD